MQPEFDWRAHAETYADQTEKMYQDNLPTERQERDAENREMIRIARCRRLGRHRRGPNCALSVEHLDD